MWGVHSRLRTVWRVIQPFTLLRQEAVAKPTLQDPQDVPEHLSYTCTYEHTT
ncbi:15982_t:CDS:2, partial [Dentiscutata heterogama]